MQVCWVVVEPEPYLGRPPALPAGEIHLLGHQGVYVVAVGGLWALFLLDDWVLVPAADWLDLGALGIPLAEGQGREVECGGLREVIILALKVR